jgi:hydroxymethylbilane synthase
MERRPIMPVEPRPLRVGTRGSALALWQADEVCRLLREQDPDIRPERVIIKTLGDRRTDVQPADLGEVGLFTKELERELLRGDVDIAVHSLKDLPTADTSGLRLSAILPREDPRDALVGPAGLTLDTLPPGARVGTSSLRRRAQLLSRRPDIRVLGLRGNVPTRLDRLTRNEYDALIMAMAGLKRLGLQGHVCQVIEPDDLLSAPGQGAVAVQVRADDERAGGWTAGLDHAPTRIATATERAVLARLEAGCHAPVGALATWEGDSLDLRVVVGRVDGTRIERRRERARIASEADGRAFGIRVADELLSGGAAQLLGAPAEERR